ncbi:MAG: NACHT domain-containing protein [Thermoanaerobaculia bacterium]
MTADSVPAWLWQTPTSAVEPPVQTRAQDLPVEKLEWTDFERLCVRLAAEEANVEHAQQYGRPGQKQHGLDVFARKFGSERYTTWQCKKYQSVTAKVIRKAADEFLNNAWADKTEVFYFCVTDYVEDRTLADEIEAVARGFADRNIRFLPLGKTQLSTRLKLHPALVDDFFGRQWVTAFCGSEAAERLSGRKMSSERVAAARKLLRDLYAAHFAAVDPGLPAVANRTKPTVPLLDRFVMPDVLEQRTVTIAAENKEPPHRAESHGGLARQGRPRIETREVRSSLARWFEQNRLFVILADAGRGKTTLLSAIALDLLADEPRHEGWARTWRDRIPVWIPFGAWVTGVLHDQKFGLGDVISNWLNNVCARPELHDLLKEALEDDRLLLLVDGVDEWTDEEAAGTALTLLQMFVASRQVAAVATSRPLGYRRLGGLRSEWIAGDLAPFSTSQQQELAFSWFARDEPPSSEDLARSEAVSFIAEIGHDAALSQLASTPLLLSGLVALHIAGERLPRNRFLAYQRLTSLLTSELLKRDTGCDGSRCKRRPVVQPNR